MANDALTHGLWKKTSTACPATGRLCDSLVTDVVVIGGGYTGLSTALHLRERGIAVVVLEAIDIGHGGSGRNVGLVNAGMWVMPSVVTDRLGTVFGERLLRGLARGVDFVLWMRQAGSFSAEMGRFEASAPGSMRCGRNGLYASSSHNSAKSRSGPPGTATSA